MYRQEDLAVLHTLSKRLYTEGIVWIVISIFQILSIYGAILGIINLVNAVKSINLSKQILKNPVGIWQAYPKTVMGGDVVALIWNLFFGAVIGIIGNIYHINCVNGYVVKHRDAFERIESEFRRIRPSNQTQNVESKPALA